MKMLPIVPGCNAVIVSVGASEYAAHVGKLVTVVRSHPRGTVMRGRLSGEVVLEEDGFWEVEATWMPEASILILEKRLVRISGDDEEQFTLETEEELANG